MNRSQQRILTTLRDGGSLARDVCRAAGTLRRKDRSIVCNVNRHTIDNLIDVWGYLEVEPEQVSTGMRRYRLTPDGSSIAATIRNRLTP